MISIAVFAPINSDKKTTERLQRTADCFLSELAAAKTISSENIVRSCSVSATGSVRKPFLWSLSECDIAQGEAILSKIKSYQGSEVAVLSSVDQYGKTFFEWIPFQASQLGIKVTDNILYKTKKYIKHSQFSDRN